MSNRAWVTLATNDSYGLGALVLAHSLRRASSAFPAVVLITPSVTEAMRERLSAVFAEVITVDVLDSGDAAHLALLQRPELGITFTKLHCWNLTQYDKCVFLDADTLIVQNCDELFEREELSAAPDVGWPDCFNSGVFVFKPSAETFSNLIKFAQERGSFDGGDQGLLNLYFADWAHGDISKHLPFLYNVTSAAFYSYLPALKQYGQNLKIIHFIGATKPWLQHYNWRTRSVDAPEHLRDFLQLWWSLFVAEVHSKLDKSMVEVEEPPPVNPQHEPEYADEGLNTGHYEAMLNPHSEFPWHHPNNQMQYSGENEPTINMTEFHDPWNIYRGHIPPITDDSKQEEQPQLDHHEVRKYAWQYMPPVYEESHRNHTPSQIEGLFTEQPFQDTHYTNRHKDYTNPQSETQHIPYEHRQENPQIDQTSRQHFHEKSHTEYVHHSDNHEPPKTFHNYNYEHHNTDPQRKKRKSTENQNSEPSSHITQNGASKTDHNLIVFSDNIHYSKNDNFNEKPKNATYSRPQEPTQSCTPYVYTVHLDYNSRNDDQIVNGYFSDDECDSYDEILPRHPYDGFYLRHQNTIDSRGKKICSHEIPPLPHSPTPTPTPPGSPEVFEDALDFPEETNAMNGEDHTGVAGHLARIGEALESEAIDELVRRQGWEAGNIDYMGADSFDNIWAKISQTLSQPPSSPPKQQSPPPAQSPIGGKHSSSLQEPLPITVEAATKDLPQEEPLPVPVETDTEKLALKEPLPMTTETDTKTVDPEESLPGPVETDTNVLAQDESSPVLVETEKKLAPEELLPESLQTDTKQVAPEETVPVSVETVPVSVETVHVSVETVPVSHETDPKKVPLAEPVPLPVKAVSKELPSEDIKPTEADTKTLPSQTLPKPMEADTKELPSEVLPEPIEKDNKTLSSEVLPPKMKPDTKEQPLEVVPPQTTESDTQKTPEKPTTSPSEDKTEKDSDIPVSALEALKLDERKPGTSDSPPLATTPSKEDASAVPAAKLEERRKPAGKLQLHPPAAADPLPTPDSELEDAATLAQSIIASELRTPTVTSPSPTTEPQPEHARTQPTCLGVQEPEVPTPPVGAVSLTQIGIKSKTKPTIAAQIESSVLVKTESTPQTPTGSAPSTPSEDAPKKKLVKKVVKKEKEGASSGEAPVPPPRKKEKKPKDK